MILMELNPYMVVWEYTLMCDSKCIHCGSNAKKARTDELTTAEALSLVNQIAEIGFKKVILSGGEPTLRNDWSNIARAITEKGVEFGIISNALSWNSKTIDKLVSLNPFAIGLSIDGMQEVHDYLRGVKGSYDKVFSSISELKKRNQAVCAVTSVNKMNIDELFKIRNQLYVSHVDAWQIQVASPMGRMKEHGDIVLDRKDYPQLARFISETRKVLPNMNVKAGDCVGYYGSLEEGIRDSLWEGCGAGIYGTGIESNGNVKGCLSLTSSVAVEGNIRQKSLREIWENPDGFRYNRHFSVSDLKGQCKGCFYGEKCRGGCNSQSLSFFGEFNHAPFCLHKIEEETKVHKYL